MHGKNEIRKQTTDDGLVIQVHEVFATLQGEGPFSGMPAVFVRLTGCHLACTFCDTGWRDDEDPYVNYIDLAERAVVKWDQCMGVGALPLFVLTGGEPVRQNIEPLILEILRLAPNAIVQVETAGSFYRDILANERVQVVVSPKTSFVNPQTARLAVAYKYIIRATDKFHADTGTPLSATQASAVEGRDVTLAKPPMHLPKSAIFLHPCDEYDEALNKANLHRCYELAMLHGYRVGLQVHKILQLP
jgi:7-carboxy-7-deazaguanine synthase